MNLSPNAKKILGDFVLDDLEETIKDAKKEIVNLQIAGFHAKAEKKQKALLFYWELWNALKGKIANIEVESNFEEINEHGTFRFKQS